MGEYCINRRLESQLSIRLYTRKASSTSVISRSHKNSSQSVLQQLSKLGLPLLTLTHRSILLPKRPLNTSRLPQLSLKRTASCNILSHLRPIEMDQTTHDLRT